MKKLISVLLFVLLSTMVCAADNVKIGDANFIIQKTQAVNAVYSAIDDMEGFLENFKPVGAQISKPRIIGNNLEFVVKKTVMMITKTARLNADVSVIKKVNFCAQTSTTGFEIYFDLAKSDALVSNNIDAIIMDFCITEKGPNQIQVSARGFVTKAPTFDGLLIGPMMIKEIGNQIPALVQALKIHVGNQK